MDSKLSSVKKMQREPEYLVIGQVVGVHGLRGDLKVRVESDDPERFYMLKWAYLGDAHERFRVRGVRFFKGFALLRLEGIADRTTAEAYRGQYVWVHVSESLPLGEDEYYFYQIEGLTVQTDEGEVLGHVVEILETGANDVYVVRGPQGEILLPAIKDVILDVDLAEGVMTVHLLEGLR